MIVFIDRANIYQQCFPKLALGELKKLIEKNEINKKGKKSSGIIIDEFHPITYVEKLGITEYSVDFLIGESIGLLWSLLVENKYQLNKNSIFFVYDGLITSLYHLLDKNKAKEYNKKIVSNYIVIISEIIKKNDIYSIFFYDKKDNLKNIKFIEDKFPKNKLYLFEISKKREYKDEFNDFLQVLRNLGLKILEN